MHAPGGALPDWAGRRCVAKWSSWIVVPPHPARSAQDADDSTFDLDRIYAAGRLREYIAAASWPRATALLVARLYSVLIDRGGTAVGARITPTASHWIARSTRRRSTALQIELPRSCCRTGRRTTASRTSSCSRAADAAGKGGNDQAVRRAPEPARSTCGRADHAHHHRTGPSGHFPALRPPTIAVPSSTGPDNGAGVERVMGFCSDDDYAEFSANEGFERLIVDAGTHPTKFWFSVTRREQRTASRSVRSIPYVAGEELSPMDLSSSAAGAARPRRRPCSPGQTPITRPGS